MAKSKKTKPLVRKKSKQKPVTVHFDEVLNLIKTGRARAFAAINTELIDLYWRIGEYISRKIREPRFLYRFAILSSRTQLPYRICSQDR